MRQSPRYRVASLCNLFYKGSIVCVLQKVPTKIVDEIPVKNKATRKSGMFCDHYLFKDTIITKFKVKIAPGQRVEWENAKK